MGFSEYFQFTHEPVAFSDGGMAITDIIEPALAQSGVSLHGKAIAEFIFIEQSLCCYGVPGD